MTPRILKRVLAAGATYALIAVAATLIVGTCAVNSVNRIGKPFPGFFVWDNLLVPAVGEFSWTGVASGLRYYSWVVAVDGRPVSHAGDLQRALTGRSPGERVPYSLEKDGERYSITVPLMTMDARAWASVLGIYLFDGIVLLLLAVTTIYMKPDDSASRALFLFSTNLSLYLTTSTDLFGPYLFRIPYFFFVNFVPATVFGVLTTFPVARVRRAWEDTSLVVLALGGAALAIASNTAFGSNPRLLLTLDRVTHGLLALAGLAAITFFAVQAVRATTPLVRARVRVVLTGTVIAFTLPVVLLAAVYFGGFALPLNVLTVFFVFFPLAVGYAIAKHDLFEIERAIKRTIVYVALSALVFGAYTMGIGTVDAVFESLSPVASRLAEGALILLLIMLTTPSRDRIQNLVDRLYDRRHYDYREVVRTTSRRFTSILDLDALMREVLTLIDETIQPETAAIYTIEETGGSVLRGGLDHRTAVAVLEADTGYAGRREPIARALRRRRLVTIHDQSPTISADHAAALHSMGESGVDLAFALELKGGLVGLLLIGPKRAGGDYVGQDLELLHTICDQLSIAIANARSYNTIDALNRDLATKNVALQEANRVLRDTQAELVEKERLAALGELAGAVAHAIRNPLAGIKAAAQLAMLDLSEHEAEESVRDVISETNRLDERIAVLLDFAKPFFPDPRVVALADVVRQAIHSTAGKAAARGVLVEADLPPALPDVRVDPILFEQAVLELISNAIDASSQGATIHVRVGADHVHGARSGNRVWVEVADAGPGLGGRSEERLFDLFYTTKAGGTGFGLATVKRVVSGHAGQVSARDRAEGGAVFRIEIPAFDGGDSQ